MNNGHYHVSAPAKLVRASFISDFNRFEKEILNSSNLRKHHRLSYPETQVRIANTGIPRQTGSYSILSSGVDSRSRASSLHQLPSPSYHSATSVMSIEEFLRTPDQGLPDLSRRIISPHWSVGRPINKSGTPSPLELSPGELEYLDSYMPSPKRWPSPVSDVGSVTQRGGSLRIRLQKAAFSEHMEANERMFFADNTGSTHLYEIDATTQADANGAWPTDLLSQGHSLPTTSLKLERKLFEGTMPANPDTSLSQDYPDENTIMHNTLLIGCNKETTLTAGWSHRYKNLIVELKGSLGNQEDESGDQAKAENFNPIADIDPHWMDVPRLSPLERPRLNKLQRWGLIHTYSKANLKDGVSGEQGQQNLVSKPSDFPFLEASSTTLKEDYNFGNLELSPERRGGQSDSDDDGYSKSYWEGFDEAYSVREPRYPRSDSDEEEKWKLSMGKWAEKGVEVMKPVNEEGRDHFEGNALMPMPLGSAKAVHWVDLLTTYLIRSG